MTAPSPADCICPFEPGQEVLLDYQQECPWHRGGRRESIVNGDSIVNYVARQLADHDAPTIVLHTADVRSLLAWAEIGRRHAGA